MTSRVAVPVLLVLALLPFGCGRRVAARGGHVTQPADVHHLMVDGLDRGYREHLPAGSPSASPLVLVLHGGDGDAAGIEAHSTFDAESDANGFIAVYPDGLDRSWADGRGADPSDRNGVDDVAFLAAVVGDVEQRDAADPSRVFVTGISNGGFMAERFACDRADLVAAIAPVAASMGQSTADGCNPSRPVSVMDVHGTADPLVPYDGGSMRGRGGSSTIISAVDVFARWSAWNGCTDQPGQRMLPSRVDDGTSVQITSASACPAGVAVELWTVVGGGHTWPGGEQYLPVRLIGPVSHQFDAPDAIWKFFAAHGR